MLSSEPFDQMLQTLAANLGEIALYEGLTLRKVTERNQASPGHASPRRDNKKVVLDTSKAQLHSVLEPCPRRLARWIGRLLSLRSP